MNCKKARFPGTEAEVVALDQSMVLGLTDYISKPIDDEVLIKTIEKYLKVR